VTRSQRWQGRSSRDRRIRTPSHSLTGLITKAIIDARMNDVKNGQAI
jgi:hypothetical protein